jgi:hypothetical protein
MLNTQEHAFQPDFDVEMNQFDLSSYMLYVERDITTNLS